MVSLNKHIFWWDFIRPSLLPVICASSEIRAKQVIVTGSHQKKRFRNWDDGGVKKETDTIIVHCSYFDAHIFSRKRYHFHRSLAIPTGSELANDIMCKPFPHYNGIVLQRDIVMPSSEDVNNIFCQSQKLSWSGANTYCSWHQHNHHHIYFQLDSSVALDQYGFVVATDALAQVIFSPIFGYMADKLGGIRFLSYGCGMLFAVGNLFYANISLIPKTSNVINQPRLFFMIFARLIVGIGTGSPFE